MVCVISLSSLTVTLLVTTAAALPGAVSAPASTKWALIPLAQSEPPTTFLSLAELNKHELKIENEAPVGWPNPHWNLTSPVPIPKEKELEIHRKATCLHDPSYVAGGAVWLKYASDFCRMEFPNAGQEYQVQSMWTTATADLTDYPGWYKLAFAITDPGSPPITQESCIEGYQRIVRRAVEGWDCQGYTGHSLGDGQGSFAGGGTGDEGPPPHFYMWVVRPDWPWESPAGGEQRKSVS